MEPQFSRSNKLVDRLAARLDSVGMCDSRDDAVDALADLCLRKKPFTASLSPEQRLDTLERLAASELAKLAYAWPNQPAHFHVQWLSQSSWDHSLAIIAIVQEQLKGQEQSVSASAIKRAFRRAVKQSPQDPGGPGEGCMKLLQEALRSVAT